MVTQKLSVAESELLLHVAWLSWHRIRHQVYTRFGVRSTEELVSLIIDVSKCKAKDEVVQKFLDVLAEIVGFEAERETERLENLVRDGVRLIPFWSPDYPCELLRYRTGTDYIYPPLLLYARGTYVNLNARPLVAVVGTRRCTSWGRKVAYELGAALAREGFTIVTGLAECIDAEATRGALDAGSIVVGVRPWLVPLSLPAESKTLVTHFSNRVMILAENPWKKLWGSIKQLYFLRNRILAGMAKVVIVVEARPEGGSMHQVVLALKRGKPVIVMRHPDEGSEYWRAYMYYKQRGAHTAVSISDVIALVNHYTEGE